MKFRTLARPFITSLAAGLTFGLLPVLPASAHHAGPFVQNMDTELHQVLVRNHDWGTLYWVRLPMMGQYSPRGAEGISVPGGQVIRYKSVQTGAVYISPNGDDMTHEWQGYPYLPVPANRSIVILDTYYPK